MNKYEPLESLSFSKSNSLVSAKYKSSLVENQIMAVALTRIEVNAADENAPITARLWPGELKRIIGDESNIYRSLKRVATTMTGHTMFLEDGKGNFRAFAVVNNADYVDGVFTVEFNKNLREHVLGLENNYTSFELAVLTQFKKNSSFRIYELLKSHIYKSRAGVNGGRVDVEYNISELRFMIGLANSDDPGVKNAIAAMGNHIDWDEAYSKLEKKDRKYDTWFDFQRYVIKPAQEELAEKSNIRFTYEGVREGRRYGRIRFSIYPNEPTNANIIDEKAEYIEEKKRDNRQSTMPRDLPEFARIYETYVGHNNLSAEDIDYLLKISKFNGELVERTIQLADSQKGMIDNYMAWIVAGIQRGGYDEGTPVMGGSAEKGLRFKKLDQEIHTSEGKQHIWEMTKEKEDYGIFLRYEKLVKGISEDELNMIYSAEDAVNEYIDWVKNGRPNPDDIVEI